MEIFHNSKSRGEAEGSAPLGSKVRRGVLPIVVAVCVLAAMHVNHRGLNVDVPQLVPDGQKVRVAVDHVGGQRVAQQVRPDAAVDAGALRQHANYFAHVLRLQFVPMAVGDEKHVIREEHLPNGFESSLAPRQILFEHAQALAGNRDGALLVEFAFLQPEHAVRDIQVTDTQVAKLVIPNAAVGERGDHGLFSQAAGGVQHDGDLGLGESDGHAVDALLGAREVDRIPQVFGETFDGAHHDRDIAGRMLAVRAHQHNEGFQVGVRGIRTDQRIGAAQNSKVQSGRAVVDFAVGVQVRLETAQETLAFFGNRGRLLFSHCGPLQRAAGQSRREISSLSAAHLPLYASWQRSAIVDRCLQYYGKPEWSWGTPMVRI